MRRRGVFNNLGKQFFPRLPLNARRHKLKRVFIALFFGLFFVCGITLAMLKTGKIRLH